VLVPFNNLEGRGTVAFPSSNQVNPMPNEKILSSRRDGVGSLVFNQPEKRNALSPDMALAAAEIIEDFERDSDVRVIVLSGAGDKAFVSGGDISRFESERATPEQMAAYSRKSERFRTALRGVGKPTIAMIRGYCLGGGLSVALNCDLRICSEDAQFGIPAARLESAMARSASPNSSIWSGPRSPRRSCSPDGAWAHRRLCGWGW
jgi:enoyl-CoA hydratase/carnithine racemase